MKPVLGLILAFAIGFACRAFGIPSLAPPVIVGALLVVAMSSGYLLVDRVMARPARHAVGLWRPQWAASERNAGPGFAAEPIGLECVGPWKLFLRAWFSSWWSVR